MKLALIQQYATHDKGDNLARGLEALATAAADGANCACFAELAFERFYPQRRLEGSKQDLAETIPGPVTDSLCAAARELGMVIIPNLYERDGDRYFDTSVVIDRDGSIAGLARMVHITDYECFHERDYYDEGNLAPTVVDTTAGRIGVAICYDRHFPEYMRALALGGAELVVVPQAGAVDEWPAGLFEAELRVAAFQNGYFTALCNRVGEEECLTFAGESFVCDPAGRVLARASCGTDDILVTDLDLADVHACHARRLFLRDRRADLYAHWLAD